MKNSNNCPKCNSVAIAGPHDVFDQTNLKIRLGWRTATLKCYICLSCGYTELFPDEKGLENLRSHYESQ